MKKRETHLGHVILCVDKSIGDGLHRLDLLKGKPRQDVTHRVSSQWAIPGRGPGSHAVNRPSRSNECPVPTGCDGSICVET